MSFEERARRAGFKVFRKTVEYKGLFGDSVREERVVAYSSEGDAKAAYSVKGGRGELRITVTGARATRGLADKAESLGASVDFEEGKRLYAVFRDVGERRAGEIFGSMFPERTARLDREGKERAREG